MSTTGAPPIDLPPFDVLAAGLPDDERPSMVTDRPWLYADAEPDAEYPWNDDHAGKWLVFAPRERIDGVWGAVRILTERGLLGPSSKVSTAHRNPHRSDDSHVVCVYVTDWHDTAAIRQLLSTLRSVGLAEDWLHFKRDADTVAGRYRGGHDDGGVATFSAPPDEVRIYTKRLGGTTWLDGSNDSEVVAAIEASDDSPATDDEDWCGT